MDGIRQLTVEEISKVLKKKIDSTDVALVLRVLRDLGGSRKRSMPRERISIHGETKDESRPRFNVLNHMLVPHHELVPSEDEEAVLDPWGLLMEQPDGSHRLAKELLPMILIKDPVVQAIKEVAENEDATLPAGWMTNRVLRVVRKSPQAGQTVAYRLIVEGG